jgi:hypothetical protein
MTCDAIKYFSIYTQTLCFKLYIDEDVIIIKLYSFINTAKHMNLELCFASLTSSTH